MVGCRYDAKNTLDRNYLYLAEQGGAKIYADTEATSVRKLPDDRYEVEVQGEDYVMLRERELHAVAAERIEASTGLYL